MVMGFSKMYNLSFFLTIFSDRDASTAEGFPDIFEGIPNIFGTFPHFLDVWGADCYFHPLESSSQLPTRPYLAGALTHQLWLFNTKSWV